MFLTTSGKRPLQSFPMVWFAMTRLIASARFSRYSELSCWRSSQFSPFRGGAIAMLEEECAWSGRRMSNSGSGRGNGRTRKGSRVPKNQWNLPCF